VTTFLASFPSPAQGVWHIGIVPIRAYALFIIVGIVVALVIGDRRWVARGGERGVIYDIALWAVPFGLIGGRLYHVITDWNTYFGDAGAGFLAALRIWDGGLGIWGAVALGGVGAWIGCRQRGIPVPAFGDAIAPGIVLAQAIGRLGNYFNQELYGRETTMPWGMKIYERRDEAGVIDYLNGVSTGHVERVVQPTFLYELIGNVLVFVLLIYVDRRFRLGHGRLFALYVASYCVGRFWVELLRDDTATYIAGIRINSFTSVFVFIGAVVYIMLAPKGREDPATLVGKPHPPKEKEPKAAKAKEEVPQEVAAGEDSALVEWTKELAAVAATSGVVAGVAVAAEHDESDTADDEADTSTDEADMLESPTEETAEPEAVEEAEDAAEPATEEPEETAEAEGEKAAEAFEPDIEEVSEPEAEAEAEEAAEPEAEEAEEVPPEAAAEEASEPEAEAEAEVSAEPEAEGADEPEVEEEAEEAEEASEPEAEVASEPEAEEEAEEAAEPAAEEGEETAEAEGEKAAEASEPEEEEAEEVPEPEVEDAAEAQAEAEPEAEEATEPGAEEVAEAEAEVEAAEAEAEEAPESGAEEAHPEAEAAELEGPDAGAEAAASEDGVEEVGEAPDAKAVVESAGTRRRWRLPRFRNRSR
jgi:prolipoprotein diacylglyceryl transferase